MSVGSRERSVSIVTNHSGFGLVMVIVTMALVAGLGLATMAWLEVAQRGNVAVKNSLNFEIIRSSIKMVLDRKHYCDIAFYNLADNAKAKFDPAANLSASEILGTFRIGTSILVQMGMHIGGGAYISKLELKPIGAPDITSVPGKKIFNVELVIDASNLPDSKEKIFFSNANNPFRFSLQTDASTHEIETCGLSDRDMEYVCAGLEGATWNATTHKCKTATGGGGCNWQGWDPASYGTKSAAVVFSLVGLYDVSISIAKYCDAMTSQVSCTYAPSTFTHWTVNNGGCHRAGDPSHSCPAGQSPVMHFTSESDPSKCDGSNLLKYYVCLPTTVPSAPDCP